MWLSRSIHTIGIQIISLNFNFLQLIHSTAQLCFLVKMLEKICIFWHARSLKKRKLLQANAHTKKNRKTFKTHLFLISTSLTPKANKAVEYQQTCFLNKKQKKKRQNNNNKMPCHSKTNQSAEAAYTR